LSGESSRARTSLARSIRVILAASIRRSLMVSEQGSVRCRGRGGGRVACGSRSASGRYQIVRRQDTFWGCAQRSGVSSVASNLRVPAPGLSALEMSTSHPLPDRRTPYVGCDVMLGVRREDQGRKGDKGGSCAWEVRATATAPGLRPACG